MKANPAQPSPSHDLSTFEVATSRYFSKELVEASGLTPLGFTVGPPKFLSVDLVASLRALGPRGGAVCDSDGESFDSYRSYSDSI